VGKIQDAFLIMPFVLERNITDLILTTGLAGQIILLVKEISLGRTSEDLIKKKNLEEYIEKSKDILNKFGNKSKLPVDLAYVSGKRKEILTAIAEGNTLYN